MLLDQHLHLLRLLKRRMKFGQENALNRAKLLLDYFRTVLLICGVETVKVFQEEVTYRSVAAIVFLCLFLTHLGLRPFFDLLLHLLHDPGLLSKVDFLVYLEHSFHLYGLRHFLLSHCADLVDSVLAETAAVMALAPIGLQIGL